MRINACGGLGNRKTQRARKGFTLLELLLVIGILVMLAAFVAPAVLSQKDQADKDLVKTQVAAIEQALDLYRATANTYPSTEQGLAALVKKPEEEPLPKKWTGPYITSEIGQDPWGRDYQYEFAKETTKPKIWSFGPDGEDGTEDDIGNFHNENQRDEAEKTQ